MDHKARLHGTLGGVATLICLTAQTPGGVCPQVMAPTPITWELASNANSQPHLELLNQKPWAWAG